MDKLESIRPSSIMIVSWDQHMQNCISKIRKIRNRIELFPSMIGLIAPSLTPTNPLSILFIERKSLEALNRSRNKNRVEIELHYT